MRSHDLGAVLHVLRYAAGAFSILYVLALAGCGDRGPSFVSLDISNEKIGGDFTLFDPSGKARSLVDFRGKVVALFFGYTQCPDVCPTNLTLMAQAMRELGPDAQRVQVLFVTVDPARDTPKMLAQYVPQFYPTFMGLYGDTTTTRQVTTDFKAFYERHPGPTPTSYTIDHTTGTYVFDPQGHLRLLIRHGEKPDIVAHDLRQLLSSK